MITGQAQADPSPAASAVPPAAGARPWRSLAFSVGRLDAADQMLYAAVAASPAPWLDQPVRRLSEAANFSRLWLALAAGIALAGGPDGRRAALRGVLAIGVTSATVNLGMKAIRPRPRPDRARAQVPAARQVAMPSSGSFPSGHSASAFAFATCVGARLPAVAPPLVALAAAVACSRVYAGVHYPGDVLIGSALGAVIGRTAARLP